MLRIRGRPFTRGKNSHWAATHDVLWNATTYQLSARGESTIISDALGKEDSPLVRLAAGGAGDLVELNNRYALDGQDPNSYSGIFWTLGRTTGRGLPSGRSSAGSVT